MGIGICDLVAVGICDHIVILSGSRVLRLRLCSAGSRLLRIGSSLSGSRLFLAAAFLSVSRFFRLRNLEIVLAIVNIGAVAPDMGRGKLISIFM